MKIALSKQGRKHKGKYEAIVDDCDSDLDEFNWTAQTGKYTVYAYRRGVIMHRIILSRILGRDLLELDCVDHIDGNGLNNQRSNIRLASHSQNMRNRRISDINKSGYKGVSKQGNLWRASIRINRKPKCIGYFATPELAHAAYCEAAETHFGEFANDGKEVKS